jgi:hypothetical protein
MVRRAQDQALKSQARRDLQEHMEEMARRHAGLEAASWFVSDNRGDRLARAPFSDETKEGNFAYRDYFHGQGKNLPTGTVGLKPIENVHRSIVFQSKTTENRIVAFAVPIWTTEDPERTAKDIIGVLVMTHELGEFAELRDPTAGENQFAVLVDLRQDENGQRGSILEHPYLTALLHKKHEDPDYQLPFLDKYRLELLEKVVEEMGDGDSTETSADSNGFLQDYHDPVGERNPDYAGRWLAACEPVIVSGRPPHVQDTGWVVFVQERHRAATQPVADLAGRLMRKGAWAFSIVIAVITLLWGFVMTVLSDGSGEPRIASMRRWLGLPTQSLAGGGNGHGTSKTPVTRE